LVVPPTGLRRKVDLFAPDHLCGFPAAGPQLRKLPQGLVCWFSSDHFPTRRAALAQAFGRRPPANAQKSD
jgi:hypothetical protein